MLRFLYYVTVKDGFKPVMSDTTESDVTLIIEAPNRATADRMMKAMLIDAPNVIEWSGVCISD